MVLLDYSQEPVASEDNITDSLNRLNRYFVHRARSSYGIGVDVAEELAQDTFIRVYASVKSGKLINRKGLPNFLKRVFDNLCKDHLKSPKNRIKNIEFGDWTRPSRRTPLDEAIEDESLEPLVKATEEINRLRMVYSHSTYSKKSKKVRDEIRARFHI